MRPFQTLHPTIKTSSKHRSDSSKQRPPPLFPDLYQQVIQKMETYQSALQEIKQPDIQSLYEDGRSIYLFSSILIFSVGAHYDNKNMGEEQHTNRSLHPGHWKGLSPAFWGTSRQPLSNFL